MNEHEVHLNEQINKNKKKLVQQNLRLVGELKRLQIEIEALDDDVQREDKQDNSLFIVVKNETQAQQRQIKKLRELIQAEKHANLKENVIYIRKEEDSLIYLKKQLQNLEIEKSLVLNAHSDKLKKLTNNEPLQKHKEELQNLWAKTKKQNRELNLKMVEMEREVRKYHKLKEISKVTLPEIINSNESQLVITNAEIEKLNKEMKGIQGKWKSNIDQLDREFFTQKNVLTDIQQKIIDLEREQEIWKRRAGTLRNQSELDSDRARLSKIVLLKNNQQNKNNTPQEKKQKTFSKNIADDLSTVKQEKRLGNLASLTRAKSSPNPPSSTKHPSDIRFTDLLVPGKRQRYNSNKERSQTSIGLINFQKAEQLKSNETQKVKNAQILNKKVKQRQDKSITFKEQVMMNERLSHREKHRIKSSAASQLIESLKRKAEEVKQLNKRLEIQELKTSKERPNNKQNKSKVMQFEQSPKNGKSKSKIQKQPQIASIQKQMYCNSPLNKQRSQSSIQNQLNNPKINNRKQLQNSREKIKQKKKQLVQHLQLNKKKESSLKHQTPKNSTIAIVKKQSIQNDHQKITKISPQTKTQTLPASQKSEIKKHQQKPEGQVPSIIQRDLQKLKNATQRQHYDVRLSVQIDLQDQEDNKPRIIKRKRPAQINLVTSGTST